PPWLVIMTRGADLPLQHPVFHDGHTRPLVYGPEEGVAPLRTQTGAEVVGTAHDGGLPQLIETLRARGAHTVSFEAGPSTTRHLYDAESPLVDELLLSTYRGAPLAESQLAGAAPSPPAGFTDAGVGTVVHAVSGPWHFAWFKRGRSGLG
ncbi:MAG: hypothetical protein KC668_28535, partial [Myxococcales bacterium]|nr:hypothetical protein [Myxococcales bacterium]